MHIKPSLFAASLIGLSAVHADFVVITDKPVPTAPSYSWDAPGFQFNYEVRTDAARSSAEASYRSALGEDGRDDLSSANSEISKFVKTATDDIADVVTKDATKTITTFTSAPNWYTGLPSDVLSVKDKQASDRYTMDSSLYAEATKFAEGDNDDDDPKETDSPAVRNMVGMGAGVAAVAAMLL